ncbi:MAG: ATP-binding cassette domain-containing protein [Sedimentisphaerales bacterium]|nr:ATP-binding cassette domain-containing protein [Sedimentisphaerales bacterium]
MEAVSLDNLQKFFGQTPAVNNLNVTVPSGSVYGFLGPNGAGKTTTLRMIMDIIHPDSGQIRIFGNSSLSQAKARIGYMPEERGLYRKMTVAKVLAFFGAIKGLADNELSERVSYWLGRVELADRANKKVEELSRGMHQKLQFAVTAINEPDLLILDEPFAGLDPLNTDLLKAIMLEMRNAGKTIIFSTHVMHEAEKLCDSILLINKGQAILDDSMANIKSRRSSHIVSAELKGDADFIKELPIVKAVESDGHNFEIILTASENTQKLLHALVERLHVQRFEVKVPSLHEIFVELVGTSNVENS